MDKTTFTRLEYPAVLRHLSECAQSPAARRQALETEPWTDATIIARHWDAVEEILGLLDAGGTLPIANFDDCEEPLTRLAIPNALLESADWLRLRDFVTLGERLRRHLKEWRERMPVSWELGEQIDPFKHLLEMLAKIFDHEGQVRDAASDNLRQCRSRIRRLERDITSIFERILSKFRDAGVLQDAYWTERGGRRVLPVKSGARGKLPGLVHDTSNTGETLFVEPFEVIEPSNLLAEAQNAERKEIVRILTELARDVRSDLPTLERNRLTLIQMDLWHARAQLAYRHGLHRPQIGENLALHLIETHHPLLYFANPKQSVPLSIQLEPENRALVITGPNTGGKTTALKTIALTALMAQSAIPVPVAVDSKLPIFRQVLAEVGDDQSVSAGLSTFSAHIRRISWILEHCAGQALVLLDELGKATDPLQAGALGRAILEAFIERGALTFVTTHLGTLKDWAHDHPAARNASYRLDPRTRRPLYQIHLDTPGISEAFTIARAEGLPQEIVDAAIAQLPKEERDLSELLDTLHAKEARLERDKHFFRQSRKRADHELKELKKERAELTRVQLHAEKELEKKNKELLDQKRRDIETRIANLPSRHALSEARDQVGADQAAAAARLENLQEREREILRQSAPPAKGVPVSDEPFEPAQGDWVFIGAGEQAGRIEKIPASRRNALVVIGNLRVTAPLKDLRRAPAPAEEEPEARYSGLRYATGGVSEQSVSREILLVGQRVEEALECLDRYLDRASLAHLEHVRVVHGHGTGALREGIHEFLRSHPHARSFKLAGLREGGPAITIVTMK